MSCSTSVTALISVAATGALLLAGSAALADDSRGLQIHDTIVVSASPIARRLADLDQSVAIIGRQEIQAFAVDNLAEMLQFAGGVDVRQRGGRGVQADVGIRGTAYEQTLIMVDGVRMSDPQTGHHNMNLPVPLEHVERVEILKGPGSAAFGPNATGGAINLITRRPERNEGGMYARGGEHGYRAVGGHLGWVTADGRSNHLLSGSWRASEGHLADEPTDFDVRSAYYSGHWELGEHGVTVGLGANERDFGAYKFYVDRFPDQREATSTRLAHVSADLRAGAWSLAPTLFWRQHEDWFRTRIEGAGDFINEHETDVYGLRLGGQRDWHGGVTSIGISLTEEEIDSSALGDHDRRESSAWLEHRLPLGDALSVALSASLVDYSDYGSEWLPGASLNYRFNEATTVFLSAARSTRIPSYTELFLPGGAGNQGNPDLEPETSDFYEAGLRWQAGNQALSAATFLRETDDLIDWRRETADVDFRAGNFSGHRTWGGELEYRLQPAAERFTQVRMTYTYLRTRLDQDGGELAYALKHPSHEITSQLGLRWLPELTQSVQLRYADRRGGESAWLLSSRLAWARDGVELSIEGNNLLDERYTEAGFAPLPGRWIVAGLAFSF